MSFGTKFVIETRNIIQDFGRVFSNHCPKTSSLKFIPILDNLFRCL